MMPEGAAKRIKSVDIYYYEYGNIQGFAFFDKEKSLIWNISDTGPYKQVQNVILAEKEVIIGVVAKLLPSW